MKYFSMFSGIGGFDLALNRQGHTCIGYSEIDRYSIKTYEKNFGTEVKNYGDATKIIPDELPDFDLLCGGFPCQAFSIAGKRRGFEDTRGTLFFEIARIVKVKRPKIIFLENVKGLLNHNKGETFRVIIQTMDELGYDTQWMVLNSKFFGVPQNRERAFIVGSLRGTSRPEILPLGQGNSKTICTEVKDKFQKTVYSTEGISPTIRDEHGDVVRIYDEYNRKYPDEIGTIRQNILNGGSLIQLNNPKHSSNRIYGTEGIARTLRSTSGGLGAKTGAYLIDDIAFMDLYNHTESSVCPTLKDPCHNDRRLREGKKIRKLTPIECERLQGFPDNWTIGSDTQRYKQCGNAVTINVIEAILKRLV